MMARAECRLAYTQDYGRVGGCLRIVVEESDNILDINKGQGIVRYGVGLLGDSCSETYR